MGWLSGVANGCQPTGEGEDDVPHPGTTDGPPAAEPPVEPPAGSGALTGSATSAASLLVRGGSWQAGAQFAPLLVNLILTPYVIHGLGVPRYGLFVLVTAIAGFLGSFDGGIGASAQRFFAVHAGTDDRLATTRLLTTLGCAVLAVGVVLFAALFFGVPAGIGLFSIPRPLVPEGVFLLRTLAVVVAFGLLRGLFSAVLNARQRYVVTSLTAMGSYAIYAVGIVLTVRHHAGLRGVAVTFVAQSVFATVAIVPSACRYLSRHGVALLSGPETRAFFRYSWKVQIVGLMAIVNLQADALIIGAVLPVRQVGVYGAGANFAMQLRRLPANALAPVQSLLGRSFGRLGMRGAHEEFGRLQRLWVRGCTGWCVVGLGAVYFGVSSWLGPEFRLGAVVAVILLAGHLVNLWTGVLVVWVQVIGRPALEARYGVLGVALNVVLTVALIVPFGVPGVVVATTAAQIVSSLYLTRIVRRELRPAPPVFLRDVPVTPSLAALAVTVAVELVGRPLVPTGAAGLACCALLALPGLTTYAVLTWGPRPVWRATAGRWRSPSS